MSVAHKKTKRPSKTEETTESGIVSTTAGPTVMLDVERLEPPPRERIASASLFEAVRAELVLVREKLQNHSELVEVNLETIEGLLEACQRTVDDVVGLAESAENELENELAPATLAFASVDGIVDNSDISEERTAFSKSVGRSIAALRCIPNELRGIVNWEA